MKRYAPLILILVLVGAMAASQASAATTSSTLPSHYPSLSLRDSAAEEEEFEATEDESEFEECGSEDEFAFEEEGEEEEFELEFEECGNEEAKKKDGAAVSAPAQCLVRRAESSITTLPGSDRVMLTVHYLTYTPSAVKVGLKLKDGKGSVSIEHATKHLGRQGVLHLTTKLGDAVMDRAANAKEFDVSLKAANTPGYCGELLEQQLRSKHPVGNARVYTQPVES